MFVQKPPLGWNTWNTYGGKINEKLVMESADAMVESGLAEAGYEYVVIDDCWSLHERDENGRLVPDPEKFPHGMKYLADYIHGKGLKFGIYSCAGYLTCACHPGSCDHEWIDAKTFAEWEIDFLKYDFCFHPFSEKSDVLYKRMGLALANCGRDILFSACTCGFDHTRQWIKETGAHMWRSTVDILDSWASIKLIAQSQLPVQEYNAPGCFNDMDMLVVGMNGSGHVGLTGCTAEEYRLHFSLWAMLNSPLMIGCDIRNMDEDTKKILLNKEVLAINQDSAGNQPFFVNSSYYTVNEARKPDEAFFREYPLDVAKLAKFLDNGDIAIGIFNFTDSVCTDTFITPDMFGLPASSGKTVVLKELWTGEELRTDNGIIHGKACEAHSCQIYRAKVVDWK